MTDGTVDRAELDKFRAMAARWWDPHGPLRPLHLMNPTRIDWLLGQCRAHLTWAGGRRPLAGLEVLDVGCGGGLLAEPLTRLGATVTGIDPEPANLEVAREHARVAGLAIGYEAARVEDIAARGCRFDLVTALEVVEHVPDPAAFVRAAAATVRPGGLFVLSTLSRTLASWVAAIVAAEYLLGWVPRGTHDWGRFLKPSELAAHLRAAGLRPVGLTGLAYEPAYERFTTCRDPGVNYMIAAVRDAVGGSA
ncbi:MAG: ubiquinone biosynthesis O-methyltransferase [Geminicoccaceae bacterium]|jgi:2-polyprenyl-6-hydroxyphenyl methylase/3-demethylubiquinone-9 3-methyltransferase|nr:MAG: ubiquinone biosynthesis O-methyltransferase [Geminicoccaceae bacterium]